MSLALKNGRLFHRYSYRSLPIANTRRVISEWPNQGMMRLPETIDQGVDTACGCNCHFPTLWFFSVARVCSGFLTIAWASGFGMGVGRFSRPLGEVAELAMPDAGLDTMRRVEYVCMVPLGAGVLRPIVPSVVIRVIIDSRCVADWMEVTHWVISAPQEMFSE